MPPIPWSIILDPERLRDLESLNILDTEPEQSYDDLAEIARLICGTPVANVSLIAEDRQWFKSYIGNNVQETSVEQSVCVHAIGEKKILVINDLTDDVRTSTNTLVTGEASLRFYAGVPLHLNASFGVGTLCVLDTKPHPAGLTPGQTAALEALGRQATILLQVRRFLATQHEPGESHLNSGNHLEEIADALLKAYNLNKSHKDRILESLISSSLTYIALDLAGTMKSDQFSIH